MRFVFLSGRVSDSDRREDAKNAKFAKKTAGQNQKAVLDPAQVRLACDTGLQPVLCAIDLESA